MTRIDNQILPKTKVKNRKAGVSLQISDIETRINSLKVSQKYSYVIPYNIT
jgi:hypothetical protein